MLCDAAAAAAGAAQAQLISRSEYGCPLESLSVTALNASLAVLGQIGVNITPLLAGAGIVGVAIGFGAQALVKDIISGVFFLIDDAFRRGEYIDIGTVKGTV